MKVRFIKPLRVYRRGDVVDLGDGEANVLIAREIVQPVTEPTMFETAVVRARDAYSRRKANTQTKGAGMRYRSLTVETAPAVEPVTLAEAKQHLRVDIDDDDTYIEALIVAARQYAEEYLDRALISQQLAVRMDTFPYEFELPRPPMATSGTLTTTAVTYALDPGSASTAVPTTTTLSTSSYRVDRDDTPGRIRTVYNGTWPSHLSDPNSVTVTWWAGYGARELATCRKRSATRF
jgi:uncharacterized phiE125 gp8 family phage protein